MSDLEIFVATFEIFVLLKAGANHKDLVPATGERFGEIFYKNGGAVSHWGINIGADGDSHKDYYSTIKRREGD